MKLILASGSPRRIEFLNHAGFNFSVIKSNATELNLPDPEETAGKNSILKARDVFNGLTSEEKETAIVLGSDTIVYFNGKIYGKPKNPEEAKKMLNGLSGNTHTVYTGYSIVTKDAEFNGVDKSQVKFYGLSSDIIDAYVETGKPLDKAGAYGMQDGFPIVEKVFGSENTVIGLPTEKVFPVLTKLLLNGKNIVLFGMAGCGKSTIGFELSGLLETECFDIDDEYFKTYNKTTAQDISTLGLDAFRERETQVVLKTSKRKGSIIATGGGAVVKEENRKALKENGITVYIKRDLNEIDTEKRPIYKMKDVKEIYNERKDMYENFADITVNNDDKISVVANNLLLSLRKKL